MRIDISHITLPEDFHDMTDFYVPEAQPMFGVAYPNAEQLNNKPEYSDIISFMLEEAKKKPRIEFSLELVHEDTRVIFRGHSITSVEGKVFIFRRLPSYIPNIQDIGMAPNIMELLLTERLNGGGLVIIAGETGQGKSTTAAATIAYRLSQYGSFCLTIEDPVELPLQGFYENAHDETKQGVCFQTSVDGDGIFEAIKSSLRCYPSVSNSILFLGEVRDSMMASEVLKIAANGHLVITTMHGSDLVTSLKRFISMAMGHGNTNEAEVKSMFASVFRLMIHQKMKTNNGKKKLQQQVLFSPSSASSVANRLKDKVELLATEIQNQNAMLSQGKSIINV
jgi:Tfp pilus assembly pilus retraction ATPase PilT